MKTQLLVGLLLVSISAMSLTSEGQTHQEVMDCYALRMGMHPVVSSAAYHDWRITNNALLDSKKLAWNPINNRDPHQWFEVGSPTKVKWIGVVTQGRPIYDQWVKSYKVLYSNDGVYWDEVDSGRIFSGNSDRNTHVKHWFDEPVYARSIRLVPKSWHSCISMRLDFIFECK